MLIINKNTKKRHLLHELREHAKYRGNLNIFVQEVPDFLSNEVNVRIFLYQITNYPRKVKWSTKSSESLAIFTKSEVEIEFAEYPKNTKQYKVINYEGLGNLSTTKISINAGDDEDSEEEEEEEQKIQEIKSLKKTVNNKTSNTINLTPKHTNIEEGESKIEFENVYGEDHYGDEEPETLVEGYGIISYGEEVTGLPMIQPKFIAYGEAGWNNDPTKLTVHYTHTDSDNIDEVFGYGMVPFGLSNSEQENEVTNNLSENDQTGNTGTKMPPRQNQSETEKVAELMKKVDSRKVETQIKIEVKNGKNETDSPIIDENLTVHKYNFNGNEYEEYEDNSEASIGEVVDDKMDLLLNKVQSAKKGVQNIKNKNFVKSKAKKAKKSVFAIAMSMIIAFFAVATFVFFPTSAYTLELKTPTIESSNYIEVDQNEFNRKNVDLTTAAESVPSGTKELKSTNAKGSVLLINKAGSDITWLSNGRFYLYYGQYKYKPVYNPNLPSTITIPANNDKTNQKVKIDIVAVGGGSEYNIPKDATLEITNLVGASIARDFYAITIDKISVPEETTQKFVTETDLDLLRNSNESQLAKERLEAIKNIGDEKTFTDIDWFVNIQAKNTFDKKVGQVSESVSLTTTLNSDIYYLQSSVIIDKIMEVNSDIASIEDIIIKSYTGVFTKEQDQTIGLDVFYKYKRIDNIDKEKIKNILKNTDNLETAKRQIKSGYSSVYSIEREDLGIKIPFVTPRSNIKFVEEE